MEKNEISLPVLHSHAEYLERTLKLKTSPLAVKMLESVSEVPDGAVRPKRDRGYHLAQCQAFALSRRNHETIAMLKEDNWCPGPLMTYGLVHIENSDKAKFDSFPYGKYAGIVTAPLMTASFQPDLILIYANPVQLRSMIWSMRESEQPFLDTAVFSWSCYNAVVKPMLSGKYYIVIPDPGEYERACGTEDEMMFSIPIHRFETFMEDFYTGQEGHFSHANIQPAVYPDFPQPDIYRDVFKRWGLDGG
jgi:uncharacterized protein (DUF169 family)